MEICGWDPRLLASAPRVWPALAAALFSSPWSASSPIAALIFVLPPVSFFVFPAVLLIDSRPLSGFGQVSPFSVAHLAKRGLADPAHSCDGAAILRQPLVLTSTGVVSPLAILAWIAADRIRRRQILPGGLSVFLESDINGVGDSAAAISGHFLIFEVWRRDFLAPYGVAHGVAGGGIGHLRTFVFALMIWTAPGTGVPTATRSFIPAGSFWVIILIAIIAFRSASRRASSDTFDRWAGALSALMVQHKSESIQPQGHRNRRLAYSHL